MAIKYAVFPLTHRIRLIAKKAQVVMAEAMAEQESLCKDEGEVSAINVRKTFKYRRLKQDPVSKMARRLYKLKSRNPEFKRKAKIYRKKYMRENKMDLKRRAEVVKEMKKRLPDPPSIPRTENHRKSN